MREILFRAKRIDNGEWVVGSLLVSKTGKTYIRYYPAGDSKTSLQTAVDPDTVGQYTGLTDKNGKMIFEGDILEAHFDEYFPENATVVKVIWHENGFGTKQGDFCPDPLCANDCEAWEVIGNIYDNPKLLEGE